MTATLLSLISIFVGILGSNLAGILFKKYSFGLIGNTITGVFGSILFIKSFGRLGFDPSSVIELGTVNYALFGLNCLCSFMGGIFGLLLAKKLKDQLKNSNVIE